MSDVKVYTMQGNDPMRTIMVAFYERFIATKGGPRLELSPIDAVEFGEYLMEHLPDFQVELTSMETSMQQPCPCPICGKPMTGHTDEQFTICAEKQAKL